MKILAIAPSFYPAFYYGGPIYSTYELAKALNKTSVDVRVITTNANGNEKLKIKTGVWKKLENDLPVKYYNALDSRGTSLSMLFNLYKEIKSVDIIYLISIFSAPTPFTIFICRLLKKHLIISPKGQLGRWCLEQGSRFKKLWLHTLIKPFINFLHWHLTSEQEQQDVLAVYPSAKTFVIPNGVSEDLFSLNGKPKDKSFFNKYTGFDCSNKKVIISMGRLQKVKGFDILIEALSKLQRDDVVLLIAGEDFGERKNLEKIIDKFKLNDKVFLVGKIEGLDKIEFLRNADVFALASHHENFGLVYAEALAVGTPVVASTNTPWQNIEINNCGKWVENKPDIFSTAVNTILNSDSLQMGNNGVNYIRKYFSWDEIASRFRYQFNKILDEK